MTRNSHTPHYDRSAHGHSVHDRPIHTGEIAAASSGARRVEGVPFPVSRRTDPVSIRPGSRAIVRYIITDSNHAGPHNVGKATDVIGTVSSIDPLVICPSSSPDAPLHINPASVVVFKSLSAAPVRNSDIRAVEAAAAAAFPGIDNKMIGGWLARAGDGITERSNSAVPVGPNAGLQPVPVQLIREFYEEHSLPTMLMVPDRIGRTAQSLPGQRGPEIIVMTRPLDTLDDIADDLAVIKPSPTGAGADANATAGTGAGATAGTGTNTNSAPNADTEANAATGTGASTNPSGGAPTLTLDIADQPSQNWLSMYHFRGKPLPEKALRLLTERIDGHMCFASLYVDEHLAAITRGTITPGGNRQWLGFSAVEVAPEYRRRGLASAMGAAILDWGAQHGADAAYLDVIATNVAGRALYHRLGFSEHHRHRSLTLET